MIVLEMDAVANKDGEWACFLFNGEEVKAHWVVDAAACWMAMKMASITTVPKCLLGCSSFLIVLTL